MVVFISGKIEGDNDYLKKFRIVQHKLEAKGHVVLNPAAIIPKQLDYEKQMYLCFAMIDTADCVYFLSDYKDSKGAVREEAYAIAKKKDLLFQR